MTTTTTTTPTTTTPTTTATTIDPVTFAVVRNGLLAAGWQAYTALQRTAMSPGIYDMLDFAVSVYDDRCNLVAEASKLPVFSGSLDITIPRMIEVIGRDRIAEGDVLLTNLPHLNGSHPPDVVVVKPVFHQGRLMAYVGARAHVGDMGGKAPFSTDSTEVFQEGLLFPPLKLAKAGELDDAQVRMVRSNSRTPEASSGNVLATYAAVLAGADALGALIAKYGPETYYATVDGILDHGERMARAGLARIADGVYTAEGALDDDGVVTGVPVPLKVTVTIDGSDMTVDTTGSSPQVLGPFNCPTAYTQAFAQMVLKTLVTPDFPANSGEQRALRVIAPEGSIFNPGPTAASFVSYATANQLQEMILYALASALPDEIPAMSGVDVAAISVLLRHPRTGRWTLASTTSAVGMGAKRGADGPNVLYGREASGLQNEPLEVLEARYPFRRLSYRLDTDSGGTGQWRGGLGMIEEHEYESAGFGTMVSDMTSGAARVRGLAGGKDPKRLNGVIFFPGTDRELGPPSCKRTMVPLAPGDRAVAWTAGGGGYGDPLERDPEKVAWDVKNEYVSRKAAFDDYGVVITDDGRVDETATLQRRTELRA